MASATQQLQDTPWTAKVPFSALPIEPARRSAQAASNIRAVGYIARPESIQELTTSIKGQLINMLREMPGFSGAVILHAHKEWRNVTILTFWETETQARNICWEALPSVEKLIYPLVDVCTKVQTFEGTLPDASGSCAGRSR